MKKFLYGILALIFLISFFIGVPVRQSVKAENGPKLRVFVHFPSPHKEKTAQTPTCLPTSNDQVNDWSWAGWQMPLSGMTYKINYGSKPVNLSNSQIQTAISTSFSTWTSADSKQIFNYGGSTTVKNAKYDGTNALLWKNLTGSAIAITYVWYHPQTGQLLEADTIFNKRYKWSYTPYNGSNDCGGVTGTFDLQNIATHEFGHWIGLDDLYAEIDKDLTMYGYGDMGELKKNSLGAGDIIGVNAVAP